MEKAGYQMTMRPERAGYSNESKAESQISTEPGVTAATPYRSLTGNITGKGTSKRAEGRDPESLFAEIWKVFPRNPTSSHDKAKSLFLSLSETEANAAAKAAPRFAAWWKVTVLSLEHVVAFVGMGEGPVAVSLRNVLGIRERHRSRSGTRNWTASVGDKVEVSYGAFSGQHGQIVELVNGAAKVKLFGGTGVLEKLAMPLSVPEAWVKEAINGSV